MCSIPCWGHNTRMNDPWVQARKAELKQISCAVGLLLDLPKKKFTMEHGRAIDNLWLIKGRLYQAIVFYYEDRNMKIPLASRSLDLYLKERMDFELKHYGRKSTVPIILDETLDQCPIEKIVVKNN